MVRGGRQYSTRDRARGRFSTRGSGYGSRGSRPPRSQSRGNGRFQRGHRNRDFARHTNAMNKLSTSQGEVSPPCFSNNHDIRISQGPNASPDIATAGKLAKHLSQWTQLTSDKEILQTVSGLTIELSLAHILARRYLLENFTSIKMNLT